MLFSAEVRCQKPIGQEPGSACWIGLWSAAIDRHSFSLFLSLNRCRFASGIRKAESILRGTCETKNVASASSRSANEERKRERAAINRRTPEKETAYVPPRGLAAADPVGPRVTMPTAHRRSRNRTPTSSSPSPTRTRTASSPGAEFPNLVKNNPRFRTTPSSPIRLRLPRRRHGRRADPRGVPQGRLAAMQHKDKGKDKPAVKEMPATPEGIAFFEKKIRPVLVDKCYECHSAETKKIKGGLPSTPATACAGGDTGPVIVPGKPDESLLIKALHHKDDTQDAAQGEAPRRGRRRLREVGQDGRRRPARRRGQGRAQIEIDIEKGRQFWAFQPPKDTAAPTVKDAAWPRDDIDRFLLAALEAKGLKPVGDADRRTLLRRVYFDLIGLPPTPEEVDAFVSDAVAGRVREGRRSAARLAAVRRALGPALARRRPLRRVERQGGRTSTTRTPGAIATTSSPPSTPTSRTTSSSASSSPATCCRPTTPKQKAEQLIATGFLAIGPKTHERAQPAAVRDGRRRRADRRDHAGVPRPDGRPAPAATITSSTRSRRRTTTPWPASSAARRRATAPSASSRTTTPPTCSRSATTAASPPASRRPRRCGWRPSRSRSPRLEKERDALAQGRQAVQLPLEGVHASTHG